MANALYGLGRQAFLDGDIDWSANAIRAVLVDTTGDGPGVGYTVSIDVHNAYDDLGTNVVDTESAAFTTKTSTLGTADADDITFTTVASPVTIEALVIFQDVGTASVDRLIAYIDTATGLPVTANDGDITVTWDDGANKIFTL
jgi:hypothetical protein